MRLTLEESALDQDTTIEQDGLKFLVHERDQRFFENTKLDFVRSFMGGGRFDVIAEDGSSPFYGGDC